MIEWNRLTLIPSMFTASISGVHRSLYGPHKQGARPVSDRKLWRMLNDLRSAPDLEGFRLWLVGSRLEVGRVNSDVDLVLSPAPGTWPNDSQIENALLRCRHYGLYSMNPICIVDPCFRRSGPTTALTELPPSAIITTTKLFSPCLRRDVLAGRIRDFRLAGCISIEYSRRAGETVYYSKLPYRLENGVLYRYLRPAVEVV